MVSQLALSTPMRMQGFTLVELMIVVAIVGILAALSYPSYLESVQKTRRADAKTVLLEGSLWMEQFYTANHHYSADFAADFPTALKHAPKQGGPSGGYYAIALTATANAFVLTATPQSAGQQDQDRCGALTLAHTGAKGADAVSCW